MPTSNTKPSNSNPNFKRKLTKPSKPKPLPKHLPKSLRHYLKQVYKRIDTLTIPDVPNISSPVNLQSSLYNGEVPFESTVSAIQPTTNIDFFQDEYINLLYSAFDLYSTLSEYLIEREEAIEEKAKHKGRNYYIKLYAEWERITARQLFRWRLYLCHTLHRIIAKRTDTIYIYQPYKILDSARPEWYPAWKAKRTKLDNKIESIIAKERAQERLKEERELAEQRKLQKEQEERELEELAKEIEELERQEQEKNLQEQMAKLQAMFNE